MRCEVWDHGNAMAVKFAYSLRLNRLIQNIPSAGRKFDRTINCWLISYDFWPYVEETFADAGVEFRVLKIA